MRSILCALALAGAATPALGAMAITSPDLAPGKPMPAKHVYPRCGGQNVSPALAWRGVPAGAKSLVLTMIDMDVKPAFWTHWIVVDLPPQATGLPEGAKSLPPPARAVVSNFGDPAYDGPCPPPGSGVHHYQFTVWAMRAAKTDVAADAKAPAVIAALTAGSLAHAQLTTAVAAK